MCANCKLSGKFEFGDGKTRERRFREDTRRMCGDIYHDTKRGTNHQKYFPTKCWDFDDHVQVQVEVFGCYGSGGRCPKRTGYCRCVKNTSWHVLRSRLESCDALLVEAKHFHDSLKKTKKMPEIIGDEHWHWQVWLPWSCEIVHGTEPNLLQHAFICNCYEFGGNFYSYCID